jgi:hypothetical protein
MKKLIILFCFWLIYAPAPGQKISLVEYFFNEDPGFGEGISVPVTWGTHQELVVNIPLDELDLGLNSLYIRAKSENGNWGPTFHQSFWVSRLPDSVYPKITAIEYFFNNDPGFGKGISIPVNVGKHQQLAVNLPLDKLELGFNTLYVRAKSEPGTWGHTFQSSFLVTRLPDAIRSKITALEYFIDTDPGVGKAIPISLQPDYHIVADVTLSLDALSDGQHLLFVRAKDDRGVWSAVFQQQFMVTPIQSEMPVITKAEYFVNTDPGFGKGIPVPINTPRKTVTKIFDVAPKQLTTGNDTVYIRVQDDRGKWSPTYSKIIQTVETASGNPPENPVVSGITENSVNLGWDAGSGTGWDIVWGLSGFDYTEDGILVLNAGNNSHLLEELSGGTAYEFYIRSWYSTGLVSNWGGPYSFTTSGATGIDEINSGEITIFPNPASNKIFIRFSNLYQQETNVRLSNIQGQLMRELVYNTYENGILQMDLNGIVPGIYFLNLKNRQLNLTRKVIIQY